MSKFYEMLPRKIGYISTDGILKMGSGFALVAGGALLTATAVPVVVTLGGVAALYGGYSATMGVRDVMTGAFDAIKADKIVPEEVASRALAIAERDPRMLGLAVGDVVTGVANVATKIVSDHTSSVVGVAQGMGLELVKQARSNLARGMVEYREGLDTVIEETVGRAAVIAPVALTHSTGKGASRLVNASSMLAEHALGQAADAAESAILHGSKATKEMVSSFVERVGRSTNAAREALGISRKAKKRKPVHVKVKHVSFVSMKPKHARSSKGASLDG